MVNAQNYIDTTLNTACPKNTITKIGEQSAVPLATEILVDPTNPATKLEGDLILKDYPELNEFDISEHALTSLTVINCPKLEIIDVSNNFEDGTNNKTFTRINLEKIGKPNTNENKLKELSCGDNSIVEVSFANLGELEEFNCPNSPDLDRFRNLEKANKIRRINLTGSAPISFMHEVRANYLKDAVEEVKKALALNPNQNLPTVEYTDSTGKKQRKIDAVKLKADLEDKVVSGSAVVSQLKTEKATAERERDEAKVKLENQKDYDTIKAERDQKTQEFQAIAEKLGLTGQVTQDQILTKIAELMDRPTGDKVSELERKLAEKDRRIGELENEKKEVITKNNVIEKSGESSRDIGFAISAAEKKKISQASTGLEAWEVRDKVIKEKFIELKKGKDNAFYLNIGLGSLTVLCLLVSGWLIVRQTNSPKTEPEKSKE